MWSTPAHCVVPMHDEDGKATDVMSTQANYCPFCGAAIGREHIPFEPAAQAPGKAEEAK